MKKISFNILYYHKNFEREKYLTEQMKLYGINPNWIRKYDREELEQIHYDKIDRDPKSIRRSIEMFIPENIIEHFIEQGMNDAEVSLNTKHVESMRAFLNEYTEKDYYVVLEDDAILFNNFRERFLFCIQSIPSEFDLFHFDLGNLAPHISPDKLDRMMRDNYSVTVEKNQLPAKFQLGSAGFCMSYRWCKRVVDYYDQNGFCVPSDWQFSSIFFDDSNSRCYVSVPSLMKQGSFDTYGSSVRDRANGDFK